MTTTEQQQQQQQTPASGILRDVYLSTPLVEAIWDIDRRGVDVIDALRIGDQVLTMGDGRDDSGQPVPGYAYCTGILTDDPSPDWAGLTDESGAQWADTEADAREAVEQWVRMALGARDAEELASAVALWAKVAEIGDRQGRDEEWSQAWQVCIGVATGRPCRDYASLVEELRASIRAWGAHDCSIWTA